MASDDRHERVRGALAVALAVFLTYKKLRQARTLVECALVLDTLEHMETTEGDDGENDDGPRVKHSASPPTIGFFASTVVYNAQESRAEMMRPQRGQKLL